MPQDQDEFGTSFPSLSQEDFAEAAFYYTIGAFEELCEEDASKVWKELPSHTKAHLRRMVAIEQLKAGEL